MTVDMIVELVTTLLRLISEYENDAKMTDDQLKAKLDAVLAAARAPDFAAEDAKVDAELKGSP